MTGPALSETIAVCLQLAHTTDIRIRLREDGRAFRAEEAAGAINPADLSALALGLSLAADGGGLAAVTVGPEDWEAPLREALAAGAVQAVRVWNGAWPAEVWAGAIDGSAGHTAFCARMAASALARERRALPEMGRTTETPTPCSFDTARTTRTRPAPAAPDAAFGLRS